MRAKGEWAILHGKHGDWSEFFRVCSSYEQAMRWLPTVYELGVEAYGHNDWKSYYAEVVRISR